MKTPEEIAAQLVEHAWDDEPTALFSESFNFERLTSYVAKAIAAERARAQGLVKALGFYARGEHFEFCGGEDEPETVSGEPSNWLCGNGEFNYEDGWAARAALKEWSET